MKHWTTPQLSSQFCQWLSLHLKIATRLLRTMKMKTFFFHEGRGNLVSCSSASKKMQPWNLECKFKETSIWANLTFCHRPHFRQWKTSNGTPQKKYQRTKILEFTGNLGQSVTEERGKAGGPLTFPPLLYLLSSFTFLYNMMIDTINLIVVNIKGSKTVETRK